MNLYVGTIQTFFVCASVTMLCLVLNPARGAGLIYHLPSDGTSVSYEVKITGKQRVEGREAVEVDMRGVAELSSVGEATVDGEACRWIEFHWKIAPHEKPQNKISRTLKMLISEKYLTDDADPLDHVLQMYYFQADSSRSKTPVESHVEKISYVEKISGADYSRRQYEIDRIRSFFPKPLTETERGESRIDTKLGRLHCNRTRGSSELPKSSLRGGGDWAWKGSFECLTHEKIPFGVVKMHGLTKGSERTLGQTSQFELDITLELTGANRNAKSSLPETR